MSAIKARESHLEIATMSSSRSFAAPWHGRPLSTGQASA
jgi:hypothetical protein